MTLKRVKLQLVKSYVSLVLYFYYKKIEVRGLEHISNHKPLLLLSNHQNGLLDPLLIATKSKRYCYYLTRAAVFKKPGIAKLLKGLNLIPVYRVRDGWETIANNNAIFDSCINLLHAGEALVIFPEGSHDLRRKVRPLSKGFTRLVTETGSKFPGLNLELVPVGVNYQNPEAYADSALLQIGTPILASEFSNPEKAKAVKALKHCMQGKIQELTTHIADDYEHKIKQLTDEQADFLKPSIVNHYLKTGEKLPGFALKSSPFRGLKAVLKVGLKLWLFPVYMVWEYVAKPKIQEAEFTGTFRFAVTATLVPIWLILLFFVLVVAFGWLPAIMVLLAIVFWAWLTVKI